jgi:soluble lytic murein transglycosylase-like protein
MLGLTKDYLRAGAKGPGRLAFRAMARALAFVLAGLLLAAAPVRAAEAGRSFEVAAAAYGPVEAVRPRPRALAHDRRCTGDGAHCIGLASYVPDVCRTLEAVATEHGVDPHFFMRLIWKESLFDTGAISPAGAQGIAQFMPGTAALRGLADPFNPAEALAASAAYLAELTATFGNIGLAAVAYNGGEARAERFLAGQGGLPLETREYVAAITGHSAAAWRDAPPEAVDLRLARDRPFQAACVAHAGNRLVPAFAAGAPTLPWGVIFASHRERAGAEHVAERLRHRYAAVLDGEEFAYTRGKRAGMYRAMTMAQVGRPSRGEAEALCARLRAAGGDCMVLKN